MPFFYEETHIIGNVEQFNINRLRILRDCFKINENLSEVEKQCGKIAIFYQDSNMAPKQTYLFVGDSWIALEMMLHIKTVVHFPGP